MKTFVRMLLGLACVTMVASCSRGPQARAVSGIRVPPAGPPADLREMPAVPAPRYPYALSLGNSVYRVEQEPVHGRLKVEFVRWSEVRDGSRDAVFRVTNPGDRPVLIWNVRQQFRESVPQAGADAWGNGPDDYPGRGWDRPTIPAGESQTFPLSSGMDGVWRVCLLYSREIPGSETGHRQFGGTFEAFGPAVQEPE